MPFPPLNQQCQSTEGNYCIQITEKTLDFSTTENFTEIVPGEPLRRGS